MQRHYFGNKGPSIVKVWFFQQQLRMWELNHKEGLSAEELVILEKTLESPLDCMEIQPVNLQGNQSWIFIGRTDSEAETPVLWPPDAKSWFNGEDPDAGKD